jgi:hypothetical protein
MRIHLDTAIRFGLCYTTELSKEFDAKIEGEYLIIPLENVDKLKEHLRNNITFDLQTDPEQIWKAIRSYELGIEDRLETRPVSFYGSGYGERSPKIDAFEYSHAIGDSRIELFVQEKDLKPVEDDSKPKEGIRVIWRYWKNDGEE